MSLYDDGNDDGFYDQDERDDQKNERDDKLEAGDMDLRDRSEVDDLDFWEGHRDYSEAPLGEREDYVETPMDDIK